jgi:hypothetical protein
MSVATVQGISRRSLFRTRGDKGRQTDHRCGAQQEISSVHSSFPVLRHEIDGRGSRHGGESPDGGGEWRGTTGGFAKSIRRQWLRRAGALP